MHIHIQMCIHTYAYTHMCKYTYMHAYTHTHQYTKIHTYRQNTYTYAHKYILKVLFSSTGHGLLSKELRSICTRTAHAV